MTQGVQTMFRDVFDLIDEPGYTCYAAVSDKGMTVTWCKHTPDGPTEGLHIHVERDKMLELAHAIIEVCGEDE